MAFDLAISENGDLVIGGARDLQGVSGQNLIEQRMRVRLRVPRGGWIYDTVGRFGSNLLLLLNESPELVEERAGIIVQEALRGMDEITIDDVEAQLLDNELLLTVGYRLVETNEFENRGVADYSDPLILTVSIPVSG